MKKPPNSISSQPTGPHSEKSCLQNLKVPTPTQNTNESEFYRRLNTLMLAITDTTTVLNIDHHHSQRDVVKRIVTETNRSMKAWKSPYAQQSKPDKLIPKPTKQRETYMEQ